MTSDKKIRPDLEAAYAVEGPDENRRLYADWAKTYESDFIADSGYVYHHHVAAIFAEGFTDVGSPVLDVGCGTGVVGEQLRTLGVQTIDGIDISPEMLAVAAGKAAPGGPVYRNLIEADLTGSIEVASNSYDGMVSAGAFTHGHLGPDALDELLRVCRPGARCVVGINSAHFEENGFRESLTGFADRGVISPYEIFDAIIYADADADNPNQMAKVVAFTLAR